MPYVEDKFVLRKIETIIQRDDYFGYAEIGGKMPAVFVDDFDNTPSDFVRKRLKFFYIQFFYVRGRFNVIEQHKLPSIFLFGINFYDF